MNIYKKYMIISIIVVLISMGTIAIYDCYMMKYYFDTISSLPYIGIAALIYKRYIKNEDILK